VVTSGANHISGDLISYLIICLLLTVIPVSALNGDNIASRSEKSPWYEGPSLLHHLEHVHIASDRNLVDVRFPVQYVIRPQSTTVTDYRGYAGQVASGVLKPGDEVMVLPSGLTSTIAGIDTADGPVDEQVLDRIVAETHGNPLALLEVPRGFAPTLAGSFGLPDGSALPIRLEESYCKRN